MDIPGQNNKSTMVFKNALPDPDAGLDTVLHFYEIEKDALPPHLTNGLRVLREALLATFPHHRERLAALFTNERQVVEIVQQSYERLEQRPEFAELKDFQQYIIQDKLGSGGFGKVFKAFDKTLGRAIAVKIPRLDGRVAPDEAKARLKREARIWGVLEHPSIVPIHELGVYAIDGETAPYFTMKFVEGHPLDKLLAERKSPGDNLPKFIYIFLQIAQAIRHAHEHDVIHRDIKPANVMIGHAGEVHVMDWGLAKRLPIGESHPPDSAYVSEVGVGFGSPPYLAPEQSVGARDVGKPADVFSLGSLLCEILTGVPAYSGNRRTVVLLNAISASLADAHRRLDACEAPEALRALAKSCLKAAPHDRPQDAGAVVIPVESYLERLQNEQIRIERERAVTAERLARAEARAREEAESRENAERSAKVVLTGLACVIVALMGVVSVLVWHRAEQARALQTAHLASELKLMEAVLADQATVARSLAIGRPKDLDRIVESLGQCRTTIEKINALGGAPGVSVSNDTKSLAAEVETNYQRSLRVRQFLRDLVHAAEVCGERQIEFQADLARSSAAFASAFSAFGVDPIAEPDGASRAIEELPSELRGQVIDAIDLWSFIDREKRPKLSTLALRLSPPTDAWRTQLREAIDGGPEAAVAYARTLTDASMYSASRSLLTAIMLREVGLATQTRELLTVSTETLENAVIRAPDHFLLNLELGNTLVKLPEPRYRSAEGCYRAAAALVPNSPTAFANLGLVLLELGKLGQAEDCFTKARQLQEDNATALLGSALLDLVYKGKADAAEQLCNRLLRVQPKQPDALALCGLAMYLQGNLTVSQTNVNEALKLGGQTAIPVFAKAVMLIYQSEFERAARLCEQYSASHPSYAGLDVLLPLTLLLSGDTMKAEQQLTVLHDRPYEGVNQQYITMLLAASKILNGDARAGERLCRLGLQQGTFSPVLPQLVLQFALIKQGRLHDAYEVAQHSQAGPPNGPALDRFVAKVLEMALGLAANKLDLEARVDAVTAVVAQSGQLSAPVSADELLVAEVALLKGRYRAARLLYERLLDAQGEASVVEPTLPNWLATFIPASSRRLQLAAIGQFQGITYRVNYIQALVMDASGSERNIPALSAQRKAELFARARTLLATELAKVRNESATAAKVHVYRRLLNYLLATPILAQIREAPSVDGGGDRSHWRELWDQSHDILTHLPR